MVRKTRMKHVTALFMVLAMLAVLAAGCAKKEAEPAASSAVAEAEAEPADSAEAEAEPADSAEAEPAASAKAEAEAEPAAAAEAGAEAEPAAAAEAGADGSESADSSQAKGIGIHHVEMEIENYGTIKLELDGDTAPVTVQNFIDLANAGFYDGLTFHRIIDGFMIQGGDPDGNGYGGSDHEIVGEFQANGHPNNIAHKKGVISMARAADPNSASSQFFIMVGDADYLDGQYAAFGHVTEGQEIVDKIAADAKPVDGDGTILKEEQPVIKTVKVVD